MPFKNFKADGIRLIDKETDKEITLSEIAELEIATPSELENCNFPIPLDSNKEFTLTIVGTAFYRLPLKYRIFFKLKTIVHKLKEIWRCKYDR